ncbi:conserved hypothetical protein [Histoplasma capsulatum G186AR]|uniref:Uncharacterized protein n=1 Tax=Ajellomyces capsulatus (strain G186AR / H82 / ATCC MYA-2454 / RMSCC 2432) TaxID=447093 RepID=C0NR84_AJECG|nr:uncharacterized protein HCBG_05514 [Histoplasma capsulatum G186AR]EEH06198.1 conserved hypothetical protein [Histoplasma capsulatum G186AR]
MQNMTQIMHPTSKPCLGFAWNPATVTVPCRLIGQRTNVVTDQCAALSTSVGDHLIIRRKAVAQFMFCGEMRFDGDRAVGERFEQQRTDYELTPLRPSPLSHPDGDELWESVLSQDEARRMPRLNDFVPSPIATPTTSPVPMPVPIPALTDDALLFTDRITSPKIFSKRPSSRAFHHGNDASLWTPFWLRKTTLFGFIILFTLLWIALLVLWLFVKRNNGLEIILTSNHYVWRFAPAAVLIIVGGLWRQVDYHCKAAYPWHEMNKGLASAPRSMVLDYVSDFRVTSFFKAIKSGHHSVASSVFGFFLLKLSLVFSTGLLVSTPTTLVDISYPLTMKTKLDGRDWAGKALASHQEFLSSSTPDSIYAYFGVSAAGMSDPTGTKDGFAYQTFDLRENHSAMKHVTSMSTDVDVLVPLPICELTDTSIQSTAALHEFSNVTSGGVVHLDIKSTTCRLGFNNYTKVYVHMKNPRTELCEPRELTAEMQRVNCTERYPQRGATLEKFLDGEIMNKAFQRVYGGIASQFAQQNLLVPISEDITGKVVYIEDRLHVTINSLWVMLASFVILSVLTVIILFTRPSEFASRDPGSIAAQATILAGSNELQPLLQDAGHLSGRGIGDKLRNYTFRTSTYRSFRITARYDLRESITSIDDHVVEASGFWKPLAARRPMLVLTFIMPMLAISALEIMQQFSNSNEGLMTIHSAKWKYVPQYLCAVVAVVIATFYNNLDFTVAMFAPFEALRKGNVTAGRSIVTHLLGKIPLVALWDAVRGNHIGAISSTIAAFAASFLTIVISGLWNIDLSVLQSHSAVAYRTDNWNMALRNYSSNDGNAGLVLRLLRHHNLTTPPWTWNEFILPKIHVDAPNARLGLVDRDEYVPKSPITYTFTLPALRPSLNCRLLTADDISLANSYGPGPHQGTFQTVTTAAVRAKLPPSCLATLPENVTIAEFNLTYLEVDGFSTGGGYVGSLFDLYLPPLDPAHLVDIWERQDNPIGCPSIGIAFGYMRANHTSLTNITAAICNQEIQKIPTEVTFAGDPNLGFVDHTNPPKYNNTRPIELLTNGTNGFSSFSFRVQKLLRPSLETHSKSTSQKGQPPGPETIDIFHEIIHGSHGDTSPELLMGAENANKLLDVVNHYYRLYMAQVINLTLRKPMGTPETKQSWRRQVAGNNNNNHDRDNDSDASSALNPPSRQNFTGTLHIATPRLKSNFGPKLALQLILAVMVILGCLAVFTMRLRETLPHNPCSIAGTMSLLAGSELCESGGKLLPSGAERMGDSELRSVFDGQGLLFGLGWWKWTDERAAFFSIALHVQ